MRLLSSLFAAIFMLLALGAPVLADKPQPNTTGYAWWSTAPPDHKVLVVQGEIDALPIGFTEPMIAIAIVAALTSSTVAKGLQGDLDKVTPIFSKTPAQYVPLVDAAYAKPDAQKLTLGIILACLADKPYGAPGDSTDKCLTSFEH
jgi:hypothetical protein